MYRRVRPRSKGLPSGVGTHRCRNCLGEPTGAKRPQPCSVSIFTNLNRVSITETIPARECLAHFSKQGAIHTLSHVVGVRCEFYAKVRKGAEASGVLLWRAAPVGRGGDLPWGRRGGRTLGWVSPGSRPRGRGDEPVRLTGRARKIEGGRRVGGVYTRKGQFAKSVSRRLTRRKTLL